MKKVLFIIVLASLGLLACNDESGTAFPVINILSPADHDEFDSGDSIRLHVEVTHVDDLHEIQLILINESLGADVWDTSIHLHSQSFIFNQKRLVEVADHSDMWLKVVAEDHNENSASDSVHFHIMP